MERKNKKIFVVMAVAIILMGGGLTYAYYNISGKQNQANTFRSRCLNVTIESESDAISLSKQIPIRPVINLKTNTTFTRGTGTAENPYIVNVN